MKVSELIQDIITAAEKKFVVFDSEGNREHLNDAISVYLFYTNGFWQVGLERPSSRQLDNGEVEDWATVKRCENEVAFFTEGEDLVSVLRDLLETVNDAESWEWAL